MKCCSIRTKVCLISCLLLGSTLIKSAFAQETDTLSSYRSAKGYVYFRNPEIVLQAARFINPAPGYLREITVSLGGSSSMGGARLRLFGHEGGSPAPVLENDLIDPIVLRKSKSGFERITLTLAEPVFLENNQFFVALDQLDSGVIFLSDRVEKESFCASGDDRFSFQCIKQKNGSWYWEHYSFAVDAVMVYPQVVPATPMGDMAPGLGIIDTVQNNRSIAWGDADGDTYMDLLWDGRLYLNREGKRFEKVEEESGLSGRPVANLFLDADNDGKLDILFLGSRDTAAPESRLFLCEGEGRYRRTEKDLPTLQHPTSFSLADVNGDGYLDLFIGQEGRAHDSTGGNQLWLNRKGKGFINVPAQIEAINSDSLSRSYGSQFIDIDNDGDPDLYLACRYPGKSSFFYNDGSGRFNADKQANGPSTLGAGAGGDWKDYDNDGDPDLLYPRLVHSTLHRYRDMPGSGIYTTGELPAGGLARLDRSSAAETVAYEEYHAGGTWGDVNNDGLLDALFTTRGECRFAELYTQNADHSFTPQTFNYGLHWSSAGEDGVWVDYDNDGWLDLCVIEWNRLRLYRNPGDGGESRFVAVDPVDADGTIDPATMVTVHAGELHIRREVSLGRGLLMEDPPRLHYGLGTRQGVDSIVVDWADGTREVFTEIKSNTLYRLVKGSSGKTGSHAGAAISAVPNPFNDRLNLYYSLPQDQEIRLEIYDQRGALVKVLVDGDIRSGNHSVVWNADDESGNKVPGGVYIYRLMLPQGEVSGRVVLTR